MFDLFLVALTIVFGVGIVKNAAGALKYGVFGIELLVSIAIIGSLLIGEYVESFVVAFLFQLGNYLEKKAVSKTRRSVRGLVDKVPKTAMKIVGDNYEEVSAASLIKGDYVLVRNGDLVPVDGVIVRGGGDLDEASITGEFSLKYKEENEFVYAGSILEDGLIEVRDLRMEMILLFLKLFD